MSDDLTPKTPGDGDVIATSYDALYNWNYESEVDRVRVLYVNAVDAQWKALRDLPWERGIDREAFSKTFSLGGVPIQQTQFWKNLPADTRWEVTRRTAAFMLSTFLHGEQGALMTASQLVSAVPDMDGKLYAATQTMDEARHVEVFAAYVKLLGEVHPIPPGLKKILDSVLESDNWMMKAVGMQIIVEGLALYSFRDMREATEEPLLEKLLTLTSRDEARHTGFGIKYLSKVVPRLCDRERAELEDFGFEAARLLVDQRTGTSMRTSVMALWSDAGLDIQAMFAELAKERETLREIFAQTPRRRGPLQGFVLPSMRAIGLFSERIAGHFEEMFQYNHSSGTSGFKMQLAELPEDLEAWVLESDLA